jgi:hypothetical protein
MEPLREQLPKTHPNFLYELIYPSLLPRRGAQKQVSALGVP